MHEDKRRVGLIGLGAMGHPMAACISRAGFALTVLDADAGRTASVASELSATAAESAADLARQADIVVTMLPNSAIVGQVLGGESGVLAGFRDGGVILEMSSGVPDVTRELATQAAENGVTLLDAPVSGGVSRAKTGELAIMVGGPDEAFAPARSAARMP